MAVYRLCVLLVVCGIIRTNGLDVQRLNEDIQSMFSCSAQKIGLAVSIVQDGELKFAEGYGITNIDTNEKVTNKTLFSLASLSKAFAATILVKLLQKSEFTIKSTVREVVGGDFQFYDNLRTKYATLEDLLGHRMGLPSNNDIRYDDKLTRKNLLDRMKYLPGYKTFRGSFVYNNLMYGILTYIAEKLGGKSWEELVREEIFQPLEMTNSTFATIADFEHSVALPYMYDNDTDPTKLPDEYTRRWALLCGSGCVMSNAVDMANWMNFHLSNGKTPSGKQLMDTSTVKDMRKPRNFNSPLKYFSKPKFPKTTSKDGYGLGWFLGYYDGMKIQWHSGSTRGYRALLTLYPDYNIGIFTALTGRDDDYVFRVTLHNYITDRIMNREPWIQPNSTFCDLPAPHVTVKKSSPKKYDFIQPSKDLSVYAGTYSHPAFGHLEIRVNESGKHLEAIYGFSKFSLRRFSADKDKEEHFYGQGEGIVFQSSQSPFVFDMNLENGQVQSIKMVAFERNKVPILKRLSGTASSASVFTISSMLFIIVSSILFLR
ncbi:hypothetical protein LOTGIDRAFT_157977 [Lottia gigantea]|uniref:Beta-lactamase-related domain-containing protein n=1 Tax=Lottia gigantea TaxID=225164 RepID=V4B2M5_LOTGI|nr:hypothetical protein LOTGIDRAFT_157977 [Lottia gigantea]ESP00687.1 hypothetical protein LOTGIDRAFT_157977 [Lottia gigantea]